MTLDTALQQLLENTQANIESFYAVRPSSELLSALTAHDIVGLSKWRATILADIDRAGTSDLVTSAYEQVDVAFPIDFDSIAPALRAIGILQWLVAELSEGDVE